MPESFTAIVPATAPSERLDRWLAAHQPDLSRARIKAAIEAGRARVNGVTVLSPAQPVKPGDEVAFVPPEEPLAAAPQAEAIDLAVIHEDADILVIDKPAGLVVHPAPGNPGGTLVNALLHHCGQRLAAIGEPDRPGIVHRLDKDTSGLMVIAKSARAYRALVEQFAAHSIERGYRAFVRGWPEPPEGRIAAPIARHPVDRKRMAVRAEGKPAATRYRTLRRYATEAGVGVAAELACRLETGRTHQVRVHMAHLSHPLIGDPVYGGKRRPPARVGRSLQRAVTRFPRQALHAEMLGICHPATGDNLKFTSPLPYDLVRLKSRLERNGIAHVGPHADDRG